MIEVADSQDLYSMEAEAAVIGSALIYGPDSFDESAQFLKADSFHDPMHEAIWSGIEKLVLTGKHVDVVMLMEVVKFDGMDWGYVGGLTEYAPTAKKIGHHARIIAEKAKNRALIAASGEVANIAIDGTLSIEQRVAQSVSELEKVVDDRVKGEPKHISEFAVQFIDTIQDRADGISIAGRKTGIPSLDRMMPNGIGDGKLVVIAARPSVGKSSLAQQLAQEHARDGIPSAFLGMEMENHELVERTVANIGRVQLDHLMRGELTEDEWSRAVEGVEALRSIPMYLEDTPGLTLADVSSKARMLVRKHGIKTLVVDYLQLMRGSDEKKERRTQLEEITRGLKRLAKQLGITVVLLSQLNRDVEKRTNPRPIMSDLKECGAIEEDADVIIFLWDHKKGEPGEPSIKGALVAKNRGGSQGEVALHFEGYYQRWTESTESLHAKPEQPHKSFSKFGS